MSIQNKIQEFYNSPAASGGIVNQQVLASILGTSQSQLSLAQNGKGDLPPQTVEKFNEVVVASPARLAKLAGVARARLAKKKVAKKAGTKKSQIQAAAVVATAAAKATKTATPKPAAPAPLGWVTLEMAGKAVRLPLGSEDTKRFVSFFL